MKKVRGFTLLELLITLALATILLGIAVPSFRAIIQSNRAAAFASEFESALYFARSEAIKRGTPITVCASNATQSACSGNTDWTNGWIIFNDPNGDGVLANPTDRLRIKESLSTGSTITTVVSFVTFSQGGFVTSGSALYTLSTAGCTGKNARTIDVKTTGRIGVTSADCP